MRGWPVAMPEDWPTRRERLLDAVREVPPGCVASYGQVAEVAGIARGARQAGRALREAPGGAGVPWFRIVRASGELAFAAGSAAHEEQVRRLQGEGVAVVRGRVDMGRYRWRPDLDELLWKPSRRWDADPD